MKLVSWAAIPDVLPFLKTELGDTRSQAASFKLVTGSEGSALAAVLALSRPRYSHGLIIFPMLVRSVSSLKDFYTRSSSTLNWFRDSRLYIESGKMMKFVSLLTTEMDKTYCQWCAVS